MGLGSGAAQLGRYVEVSKIRLGVPFSMLVFLSERNVWNAWNAKQYLSAYLSRVEWPISQDSEAPKMSKLSTVPVEGKLVPRLEGFVLQVQLAERLTSGGGGGGGGGPFIFFWG